MEIKLIELYCFICHLYDSNSVLKHQRLSNFKPRFTDQELVTCYFFAMLNNQHTKQEIYDYTARHWGAWFPALPSYQAFSYRLNNLAADFGLIFNHLLADRLAAAAAWSEDSIIDSFPVMIKRGKLSKTCSIAADVAAFGYCSSKDLYYYGVKLHSLAIRRLKSLPLPSSIFLSSAAKHDLVAFKEENPPVLTKNLFADKAYKDSQLKADLMSRGVALLTPYKRRKHEPAQFNEPLWSRFVSTFRQPIESFFHWLNEKTDYQNASRVRSSKGLLVHCYGKLAFAGLILCFYS